MGGPRLHGPTLRTQLRARERAKQAAELYLAGLTMTQIAKELGFRSKSGVHGAIWSHLRELGQPELEQMRQVLIAGALRARDAMLDLLDDKDKSTRIRAASALARNNDSLGRLSGLVKLQPVIVPVVTDKPAEFDVSRLSVEEVHQLRAIRMKLAAPALEAHGETVDAPSNEVEKPETAGDNHAENRDSGESTGRPPMAGGT